jgi:hypothetical protein
MLITLVILQGTLILEFGILSYLMKDLRFYDAAFTALVTLWDMRDKFTGLVGNTLNVQTGRWIDGTSGIGRKSILFSLFDSTFDKVQALIAFTNTCSKHIFSSAISNFCECLMMFVM